jgi:hypothetical protein
MIPKFTCRTSSVYLPRALGGFGGYALENSCSLLRKFVDNAHLGDKELLQSWTLHELLKQMF